MIFKLLKKKFYAFSTDKKNYWEYDKDGYCTWCGHHKGSKFKHAHLRNIV